MIDPERYDAVVFDLDGVLTDTASVHLTAWRRLFDDYLAERPAADSEDHSPFTDEDYRRFVDGRSRYDGVTAFLESRGVTVDPDLAHDLGDRKDGYFLQHVRTEGVRAWPGSVRLVDRLHAAKVGCAVISASRNCAEVLRAAGIEDRFPVRVDGVTAAELSLPGKPDPAVFLLAAHRLGVQPRRTVVVEDALAGVAAGRAGGFGLVLAVDRTGHPDALRAEGADAVVGDLDEVVVPDGAVPVQ